MHINLKESVKVSALNHIFHIFIDKGILHFIIRLSQCIYLMLWIGLFVLCHFVSYFWCFVLTCKSLFIWVWPCRLIKCCYTNVCGKESNGCWGLTNILNFAKFCICQSPVMIILICGYRWLIFFHFFNLSYIVFSLN